MSKACGRCRYRNDRAVAGCTAASVHQMREANCIVLYKPLVKSIVVFCTPNDGAPTKG
jgi:hypothetical protein